MTTNVLYYAESAETSDGWQRRLGEHGYNVWRTTDPDQLVLYAKTRPAVGVLLDASFGSRKPDSLALVIRRLRDEPSLAPAPLIAIFTGMEAFAHAAELADAGLTGIYLRGTPETLLLHYLGAGQALRSLRTLQDSGMTVGQLANETRQKIHDLSQPLAALQGRLQILQTRTAADNPQKEKIDLMVKLTLEVGTHLRELQEFHRQYS